MAGFKEVAAKAGVKESDVKAVTAAIATLAGSENVQLRGFGTFKMKIRAARQGMNPKTQEPVEIPEKQFLAFKAK